MLIKETSDMTDIERQTIHNQNNSYLEIGIQKVLDDGYNIDELKLNGKFAILNATGTLPSGYSADDNNFFVECYMWFKHYGRQVLHDVRTNKTFSRNLHNDEWQSFEFVDRIVEQGETTVDGVTWSWEKWNSGKAVCCAKILMVGFSTTTSFTNNYSYKSITYPFTFIELPQINTTYMSTGVANSYNHQTTSVLGITKSNSQICCSLVEENSNCFVTVEIIGKWK